MPYYRLNGAAEEFDCPECGAPVYSGERAFQEADREDGWSLLGACRRAQPARDGTGVRPTPARSRWPPRAADGQNPTTCRLTHWRRRRVPGKRAS